MPTRSSGPPSAGSSETSGNTQPVAGGSVGPVDMGHIQAAAGHRGTGILAAMGRIAGFGSSAGWGLLPQLTKAAPDLSAHFVHEALRRAISGVSRLPGAAVAADRVLVEADGDVDLAIHELIEDHVRYAGLQGFATNLGGLVTAAVLIPANITGLALIQCRLVACIALPSRLRPRRPAGPQRHPDLHPGRGQRAQPGAQEPAADHTDGDGDGARLRPAHRPGDRRRGDLRAAHQGRGQADGGHGRASRAGGGWRHRRGRRRLSAPGRSAATRTASCCLARAGRPRARPPRAGCRRRRAPAAASP